MNRDTRQTDQRGIVSFMVTLIMMLVISLIVIGFTQVTNRSRRGALDKQLSSQAFYAAESGVNKALEQIASTTPSSIVSKSTCTNDGVYDRFNLDSTNVEVTCIMVDAHPKSIVGTATQNSSFVTYINPVNSAGLPASLTDLTLSWAPPDVMTGSVASCSGPVGTFPTTSNCPFGLLRVDLFRASQSPGDYQQTATFYMQPVNGGLVQSNVSDSTTGGILVQAGCSAATVKCTARLAFSGPAQSGKYYLRISSLYKDSKSVEITGSAAAVYFSGAQVMIDATGRAQDVLRRVQVRYPLNRSEDTPPWAAAGRACKRLTVTPAQVFVSDPCN